MIFFDEVRQPRHLEDVASVVFLQREEVAAVYAVFSCKGLLATDNSVVFEVLQSLKKPLNYFLAVRCLHNSSDFAAAWANVALIVSLRLSDSDRHFNRVSGLK